MSQPTTTPATEADATVLDVQVRLLTLAGALTWDADQRGGVPAGLPPGAYEVVSVDEPGITWRRQRVTSAFVDGDVEAGATRDATEAVLAIRCLGIDGAAVNRARAALTDAAGGYAYLLEVTLAGVRSTWRAGRADWVVSTDPYELRARPLRRRLVTLTCPVQPSRQVTYQ